MKKRLLSLLVVLALLVGCLGLLAACGKEKSEGDSVRAVRPGGSGGAPGQQPGKTPGAREMSAEEIYETCSPAVFFITVYDEDKQPFATGSGFFIGENGLALTNQHVMEGARYAKAKTTDGREYDIEGVVAYNANIDAALIKVNSSGFPILPLGDSTEVKGGQQIYTIGNPQGMENTISDGLISNPSREGLYTVNVIQISAPISPGNSGGPLINSHGEVLGINSSQLLRERTQNINFAMPVHEIGTLDELRQLYTDRGVMSMEQYYQETTGRVIQPSPSEDYTRQQEAYYALRQRIIENTEPGSNHTGEIRYTESGGGLTYQIGYVYDESDIDEVISVQMLAIDDDTGEIVGISIELEPDGFMGVSRTVYSATGEEITFVGWTVLDVVTFSEDYDFTFFETDGWIEDEAEVAELSRDVCWVLLDMTNEILQDMGYSIADFGYVSLYD